MTDLLELAEIDLTATDLFCGGGGTSIGITRAGFRVVMAANHWTKAVEVHQANFPEARHDCADITQVDPRRYPRTNVLLASPECTNHTSSKGVSRKAQQANLFEGPDPGAERSRATMWDVHRFIEVHRYEAVVVENVVEAADWIYWRSWWQAFDDAGYTAQVLNINSAHTGEVPQWRDRIYVVASRKGLLPKLEIRPPSWCSECERGVAGVQSWRRPGRFAGRWRQSYDYRCPDCRQVVAPPAPPAEQAIDWSLPGERIGDRKRPLAEATRRRIKLGLERYGPSLVAAAGNTWERPGSDYVRAWPISQPTQAQSCTLQHGVAVPEGSFIVKNNGAIGEAKYRAVPVTDPFGTMTTSPTFSLVVPLRANGRARPCSEPAPAVAASGNHHGLLFSAQSGGAPRPSDAPAPTMTTKVTPLLVQYDRTSRVRPVTEPAGAVLTKDHHALVCPAIEVDDCSFRMLEPHEVGRAMAFPDSYEVEGSKKDRVRLYGNAVTPPVMHQLGALIAEAVA